MTPPSTVAITRIRELRKRHGWSQQDLVRELNVHGAHTERSAVARLELGQRTLSLDEALLYALALDVAPVHLFAPTADDADPVNLGPQYSANPGRFRAWIRGELPATPQNPQFYFSEMPKTEFAERGAKLVDTWRMTVTPRAPRPDVEEAG